MNAHFYSSDFLLLAEGSDSTAVDAKIVMKITVNYNTHMHTCDFIKSHLYIAKQSKESNICDL